MDRAYERLIVDDFLSSVHALRAGEESQAKPRISQAFAGSPIPNVTFIDDNPQCADGVRDTSKHESKITSFPLVFMSFLS